MALGEPDLLVLDEPINGLDPQGIAEIRDTIQRLQKEKNMTICIIKERLGHEKIQTTLGTYGHLYPNTNLEVRYNLA